MTSDPGMVTSRAGRAHRLCAVLVTASVLATTGCMNLRPDELGGLDAPDITFGATQVAARGAGPGFVVVSGSSSLLYDEAGSPSASATELPWSSAASTTLPDGRLVVATAPSGRTQTPQIVALSADGAREEVIVGRPEQRPLPLTAGAPVSPDGTAAADAFLGTVLAVEALPDGSVVWAEQLWTEFADQHGFVVRRLAPDGTLLTLAGRTGDVTAEPVRPVAGSVAIETFLDATDPRLAPAPDGSMVVSTQSWTVRVGADGLLTDVLPDLPACRSEPTLVEADADGLLLLRVGRAPAGAQDVAGWEVAAPSEPAAAVIEQARSASTCAVVVVPSIDDGRATVETVPVLAGASAAAFSPDDGLLALFPGSGDVAATAWVALP